MVKINRETIGERIRRERETRGLSQRDLSATSGLPQSVISLYETGARVPSLASVARVAKAMGLDAGELVAQISA